MKRSVSVILLIAASSLSAQYAPSVSGSSLAAGEINGKPNYQEAPGPPGSSHNCTIGKDFYTDTTAKVLYQCVVTGTPGTWAILGATGPTGPAGPTGPTGMTGMTGAAGPANLTLCNGSASDTAATCSGIPVPTSLTGLQGTFVPDLTTTGAPFTLNIAGLGAKQVYVNGVVSSGTNPLTGGVAYPFYYDGTYIQVTASTAPSSAQILNATGNLGGTANAILAQYSPTLTGLNQGWIYCWQPQQNNTGAATFNPDGQGPIAIVKTPFGTPTPLVSGDIVNGVIACAQYSGGLFYLLWPQTIYGGTVTSITLAGTSNEITATGTCTITATGTCTLSIPSGFVLPGTIDGLTITTTTGTLTITGAKVLTVSNSLTLAGTDGVTLTFPATSATIARTDAAQTFTGLQTFTNGVATGASPPALTAGTGGAQAYNEGTVPSVGAGSGVDVIYADSTQHGFLASFNNGSYLPLVQSPASTTNGGIAGFNGTTGGLLEVITAIPSATTATTQTSGDNTTKIATDAFVQAAVTGGGAQTYWDGTTSSAAGTAKPSLIIHTGTVALGSASPSTVTVTGFSPAFTSTSTYTCTASPTGTTAAIAAAGVAVSLTSASSVTFTGPNTVTTVINYSCLGY